MLSKGICHVYYFTNVSILSTCETNHEVLPSNILSTGLRPGPSVRAESLDAVNLSAVAGGDATLPCDTRSPQPPDALLLVVWYKNDVPIYR